MACLLYVLSAPLGQGRQPLHRTPVPRLSIPLFFIQQTAPRFLQRPSPPIERAALAAYAEGVVPLRLRRAVTKPGPDAGHGGAGGLGPRRPRPLAASPRRRPDPRAGQRPSIGRLAVALRLLLIPGRAAIWHCPFCSALDDHEKRRARRNGRALKGDALTWTRSRSRRSWRRWCRNRNRPARRLLPGRVLRRRLHRPRRQQPHPR